MSNLSIAENKELPITIAMSGASGTVYGLRTIQFLIDNGYKVEFVISNSALRVAKEEIGLTLSSNPESLKKQVLSHLFPNSKWNDDLLKVWSFTDIAASISSGSFRSAGMIIVPTSMGTLSSIAHGSSDNLITRAADVCIKENRKLVLVPREMPFSTIHLENMLRLSKLGVTIAPASPGFYHSPKTIQENIDFVVGKVLDSFGIDNQMFKRWKEENLVIGTKAEHS